MERHTGISHHMNSSYGNSGIEYISFRKSIHNPVEWKWHKYSASKAFMVKQTAMSESYIVLIRCEDIPILRPTSH